MPLSLRKSAVSSTRARDRQYTMPQSPSCSALMKDNSWRLTSFFSTMRYWMLGRSKLATKWGASFSSRRSAISRRVAEVAVAVSARRGTPGQRSCNIDKPRYSGRKSWPHCDTQCASSMANRAIRAWSSKSRQRSVKRRSGATYSRSSSPARKACSTSRAVRQSCEEFRKAALTPSSSKASTWSCIKAIKGEITTPVPGRTRAGI